jgi:hypothetical protein
VIEHVSRVSSRAWIKRVHSTITIYLPSLPPANHKHNNLSSHMPHKLISTSSKPCASSCTLPMFGTPASDCPLVRLPLQEDAASFLRAPATIIAALPYPLEMDNICYQTWCRTHPCGCSISSLLRPLIAHSSRSADSHLYPWHHADTY